MSLLIILESGNRSIINKTSPHSLLFKESNCIDHIDPKFSDRQFWANSVETNQAAAGAV